jgi:hypothetical protein
MKAISLANFRDRLDACLEAAARTDIVIMRDGKPWLIVQAVPDPDMPEFWEMIETSRLSPGIPWEEAKVQLGSHESR